MVRGNKNGSKEAGTKAAVQENPEPRGDDDVRSETAETVKETREVLLGQTVVYRHVDKLYPAIITGFPMFPVRDVVNLTAFKDDGSGRVEPHQRVKRGIGSGTWHENEETVRTAIEFERRIIG